MKVKIIKCKNNAWWYSSKIGKIFEVEKTNISKDQYEYHTYDWTGGIDIEDCIIVDRKLKLERILNEN